MIKYLIINIPTIENSNSNAVPRDRIWLDNNIPYKKKTPIIYYRQFFIR